MRHSSSPASFVALLSSPTRVHTLSLHDALPISSQLSCTRRPGRACRTSSTSRSISRTPRRSRVPCATASSAGPGCAVIRLSLITRAIGSGLDRNGRNARKARTLEGTGPACDPDGTRTRDLRRDRAAR